MANPNKDILKIYPTSQAKLLDYIKAATTIQTEGFQNRNRFENIDRLYMQRADFSEIQRKSQNANRAGDPMKIQNMQVPLVMENVENDVGFLTNVFLLDTPMFKFGTSPDKQPVADMWNTLVGADQVQYGWAGQFNMAFRNGSKYNFAPMEIAWQEDNLYKVQNGSGTNGTALVQNIYAGNRIRSLDPYNTIYDKRVPIHRCHIDGEFSGYLEPMTRIQLKLFLASLGDKRLPNDVKAFEAADWDLTYYVPQINLDVMTRNKAWGSSSFDWVSWVTDQAQNHIKYRNWYTVATLYCRIMPYEFDIHSPADQTPDIWKLVAVNNVLVYAQPMPNAHNLLPVMIVQPIVDNLDHQTLSSAENLEPFQQMCSGLWNERLAAARRRLVDRMLYNPLLVDPDHINSPNPGAKIPLRPTAYGRKLEEAIYPIPFNDANSGEFIQDSNGVSDWALRAAGNNRVSVGQFQKGNKLQDEFATTMQNAGVRQRSQAIMWETFGMTPIKAQLKDNYLQFAPKGVKYNQTSKSTVDIDPVQMRDAEGAFDVGDGLLPIEKLMNTDTFQQGMQVIGQNEELAADYEVGDMFAYMMEQKGVKNLQQFKKDPQMVAYQESLEQWTAAAEKITVAKAADTPENLQKVLDMVLGPKPVDPTKQKQQQAAAQQGSQQQSQPNPGDQ